MARSPRQAFGAAFGYFAGLLNLMAFVWYGGDILRGAVTTNPITWWLWVAETGIGLAIYMDRTRDGSKWFAEAVSLAGVFCVAAYLGARTFTGDGVFETVSLVDALPTSVAALALGVWLVTREKRGASAGLWVFQLALFSAAIPLIRSALADPSVEPFWPWAIWTGAFGCQAVCAWLRWDGAEPVVSPVNYAIIHGLVAVIVWYGAASS